MKSHKPSKKLKVGQRVYIPFCDGARPAVIVRPYATGSWVATTDSEPPYVCWAGIDTILKVAR